MTQIAGGIRRKNRVHLECLHRSTRGPFAASEAAAILNMPLHRARRLVRYLADRGWLDRVRRGVYVTVPLDAHRSGHRVEDPWVVAATSFGRYYIAGWSAAEYWDLTEQIFRDILVVTSSRPRKRTVTMQGTVFRLRNSVQKKHFGVTKVWRGSHQIFISDPSRTVVDVLSDPTMGGGIRHVGDILSEYLATNHRDDELVIRYGDRLGNRTVFKRLGFLLEALGLEAPSLVESCLRRRSSGVTALDPSIDHRGRITSRWNLSINADITRGMDR